MFYDITNGTDQGSATGTTRLTTYNTGTGFDIPTGLGSPNATILCNGLASI